MRHGSQLDPRNRFEKLHHEPAWGDVEWDTEYLDSLQNRDVEYISDKSKSLVTQNKSPDIPFRYSINPYRGCSHGCAYCYARNTHEYLGYNAGLDFETKIVFKADAPRLLRDFLNRPKWHPEPIFFSGVTDCYQPIERKLRLTRHCIEILKDSRAPTGIITKNALITRDLDLLREMAQHNLVQVFLSITTLTPDLCRSLEPRTSIPAARLRAIETLSNAGVPVGIMVAPIIPGLNDSEIPAILHAASEAGARVASSVMLRLPLTVEPVFLEWLRRTQPLSADKILQLIRQVRDGELNSSTYNQRMKGTGTIAQQISQVFKLFSAKYKLNRPLPGLDTTQFQSPASSKQLRLF